MVLNFTLSEIEDLQEAGSEHGRILNAGDWCSPPAAARANLPHLGRAFRCNLFWVWRGFAAQNPKKGFPLQSLRQNPAS